MAAEEPTTANEYILHHLTFLSNKEPKGIVDFSVIHLDTVFFSAVLALLFGGAFYFAARTAKAGVPGRLLIQAAMTATALVSIKLRANGGILMVPFNVFIRS